MENTDKTPNAQERAKRQDKSAEAGGMGDTDAPGTQASEPSEPDKPAKDRTRADSGSATRGDSGAPPAGPRRSKTAVAALLVALIALGLGGWVAYQGLLLQQQNQALSAQLQQVQSNSQALAGNAREEVGAVKGQVEQLERQLQQERQSINALQGRLTTATQQFTQQLKSLTGATRTDWLLAEVEYLLRLANQRILMERTASGALALLNAADEILKETDDVSIYPVRKALARDIAALRAVPEVDTEGLFLKLGALDEQIDRLRLIPVSEQHPLPSLVDQMSPEGASSWGQSLRNGWSETMDKLSKLVVIQHRDEPVEPLLSPEQTYYLKQNLHLMIQQAQLSLLQGEQAAFERSLGKAGEWTRNYFETDHPVTQGVLEGLEEFDGVQVSPALPDISGSLKELKSYLSMIHENERSGGAA